MEDFIGGFQKVENPRSAPGFLIFDIHGRLVQANPEGERISKDLFPEKDIAQEFAVLCRWVRRYLRACREPGDRPVCRFTPMLSTIRGCYFFQTFLLADEKDLLKSHILVVIESLSVREDLDLEEACRQFRLSRRERDVIGLLVNGDTNKEIARFLSISHETVKSFLAGIRRKLGVSNRTQILSRILSLQLGGKH